MAVREWDEIDQQMEREGQAIVRSMRSMHRPRRSGPSRDGLVPGRSRVPHRGAGAGEQPQNLGQVLREAKFEG